MTKCYGVKLSEKSVIKRTEKAVLKALKQEDFFSVEITLTDEDTIKEVNKNTRKIDSITDVLSFPNFEGLKPPVKMESFSAVDFEGKRVLLGSIMICRKRTEEQAEELGHSYLRELAFLVCHGMLHLFGYDHIESGDEEIMTALQREIVKGLKI